MKNYQKLYDKRISDKRINSYWCTINQFGGQEPGISKSEIKDFCETNFNITFPMTSKYNVKGDNAHPIYYGQKKLMVNQLYQNGIFIKF